MNYKRILLFLICLFFSGLFFANESEMLINQIRNTNEQLIKAYEMTIGLRKILVIIIVFGLIRGIGITARLICYAKRIKLPPWLDMIL